MDTIKVSKIDEITIKEALEQDKQLTETSENVLYGDGSLDDKTGSRRFEGQVNKVLRKTKKHIKDFADERVVGVIELVIKPADGREFNFNKEGFLECVYKAAVILLGELSLVCLTAKVTGDSCVVKIYYVPIIGEEDDSGKVLYHISFEDFWGRHASCEKEKWLELFFYTRALIFYHYDFMPTISEGITLDKATLAGLVKALNSAACELVKKCDYVSTRKEINARYFKNDMGALKKELAELTEKYEAAQQEIEMLQIENDKFWEMYGRPEFYEE